MWPNTTANLTTTGKRTTKRITGKIIAQSYCGQLTSPHHQEQVHAERAVVFDDLAADLL